MRMCPFNSDDAPYCSAAVLCRHIGARIQTSLRHWWWHRVGKGTLAWTGGSLELWRVPYSSGMGPDCCALSDWNVRLPVIWLSSVENVHYGDVIMGAIATQITNLTVVYSIVYSDADQGKHQSSASLDFVWGNVQWRGKCFHLMTSSCILEYNQRYFTYYCWFLVHMLYPMYLMKESTDFTNPTMRMFHTPQCTIQNINVHISVLNGALLAIEQVHYGICELGRLSLINSLGSSIRQWLLFSGSSSYESGPFLPIFAWKPYDHYVRSPSEHIFW